MTGSTRSPRSTARTAHAAADKLGDWLRDQRGAVPDQAGRVPEAVEHPVDAGKAGARSDATAAQAAAIIAHPAPGSAPPVDQTGDAQAAVGPVADPPLRLPHTDWLHHRLEVSGPDPELADFAAAARGAGTIPWQLDLARMEEDLFHLLVAPPAPQRCRLSLAGARVLARQLCEASAARQAAAVARVGRSRACAFDLHALVPVPSEILRLGPDHPDALAWLWAHWCTTAALRHVVLEPAPVLRSPLPAGRATLVISFWSADWTPWRALAASAARWPALRFDARPIYDLS
ncbi:hypothetical protein [Lichenicoccus sp.]|uniref:hypothetical protein n=1 Tax=Lichenicoccus sp. TaxID=2781899 RepID=UPI003D152FFA